MLSPKKKRDIADFFAPNGRTSTKHTPPPRPTVPLKRPSPSDVNNEDDEDNIRSRRPAPKTPAKTVTFKDVTPGSIKSPVWFSPRSQNSLPIRSPRPNKSASPSQVRQTTLFEDLKKSPVKDAKQNMIFESNTPERSLRVFEDGQVVAVRDSDDDTESLESLDEIFGRKQDAASTSDSSPLEDTEAERVKTLGLFTSGRSVPIVGKDKIQALYAKDRAAKFDLAAILDDHFGDEEAEQNISRMRAVFNDTREGDTDDRLDKHLLASLVQARDTEQEDMDRLLHAVERTEALSGEKKFSFFRLKNSSKARSSQTSEFPTISIPDQMWAPKDYTTRDQVFLSGYMAELAATGDLADDALKWIFEQVVKESQAEVRQNYVECLGAGSNTWARLNITASDVQSIFQTLGADPDCLRDASPIEPKYQPVQEQLKQDYKYLISTLEVFTSLCSDMDFSALSKLSSIILRLTLDSAVISNGRVCVAIESLLGKLLSLPNNEARSHIYDRILSDATGHLLNPQLQIQLLRHILPTTQEAIALRKTLADIFLLGRSTLSSTTNQSNATIDDLSKHISTSPSFSITRHANAPAIDYSALTSLAQILNISISSGNPPPQRQTTQPSDPNTKTKPTPEEAAFNTSVDKLADQIHTLFISIKDTGASHMRRTEAKDALQALYFRLLFSVRTHGRKKRHVFDAGSNAKDKGRAGGRWVTGEEYEEKERGSMFMKKFLARSRSKSVDDRMEED